MHRHLPEATLKFAWFSTCLVVCCVQTCEYAWMCTSNNLTGEDPWDTFGIPLSLCLDLGFWHPERKGYGSLYLCESVKVWGFACSECTSKARMSFDLLLKNRISDLPDLFGGFVQTLMMGDLLIMCKCAWCSREVVCTAVIHSSINPSLRPEGSRNKKWQNVSGGASKSHLCDSSSVSWTGHWFVCHHHHLFMNLIL